MSPDAIYTLFTDAAARFTPITGNPTDDDLTAIREVLTPLLLSIPYDEAGTHNLVGIIEHPATYLATWLALFPVPAHHPATTLPLQTTRPPSYGPAWRLSMRSYSATLPPMKLTNAARLNSSTMPSTNFGTKT
jgi:hypothetical protein